MSETFEGITFNYNDQDVEIPFVRVQDLVHFKNMKPIVVLANTGGGKTTLAIDVLSKFANEASNVYFITQTPQSYTDTALSKIPSYFVRSPGEDPFNLISGIWDDIEARVDAISVEPESVKAILGTLFPDLNIEDDVERYLASLPIKDEHERNLVRIEILTRIILDKVKQDESLLTKLDKKLRMKVNGLITNTTKSILILDDVTGMLSSLSNAKDSVYYNGVSQSKSKAFISLLRTILTRGRHMNCIIMMFIHEITALPDNVVKSIDNLILLDYASATSIANKISFGKDICEYLKFAMQKTDIYNPNRYKYYALFLSKSMRQICVTKADLADHINVSPQTASVHKILDQMVLANQNPSLKPNNRSDMESTLMDKQDGDDGDAVLSMGLDDFSF